MNVPVEELRTGDVVSILPGMHPMPVLSVEKTTHGNILAYKIVIKHARAKDEYYVRPGHTVKASPETAVAIEARREKQDEKSR